MILYLIKRFLKNFRLTTQILSIQAFAIVLIYMIVTVISFFQINGFQQYIKAELLESVIQKSIISNIQLLVGESMQLTFMIYSQFGDEVGLFKKLFQFQTDTNIQMDGQLEDCENAIYIGSYQQCYFGSSNNDSDINQINQFIQLQNQVLPYRQNHKIFLGYYNIYLGDQLYYSTQVKDKKPELELDILNIYKQMVEYQNVLSISQDQSNKLAYIFLALQPTKIAFGMYCYEQLQPFSNLAYDQLQVRTFIIIESGLILTDSKLEYKGQYFQNISGFTNLQFEMIKNYTIGIVVQNQCEQQVQGKTLCLVDNQKRQKLIFSYYYQTEYAQFIVNILDANFVEEIRQDFYDQFDDFVHNQIKIILTGLFSILGICLIIQILLIIKLSRPLEMLVKIAKYNFNNNQYKFCTLIRSKKRNQIQQLQDSYFDLINQSKQHNYNYVKNYFNYNTQIQKIGLINQMELKRKTNNLQILIQQHIW